MFTAVIESDPGYDPSGDADHAARQGEYESSPTGLLESAERRVRVLLSRPFTKSVARACCLILRTEARGKRVSIREFHHAGETFVQLKVDSLSVEIGRGSEARRRQTLMTIRQWSSYWGGV